MNRKGFTLIEMLGCLALLLVVLLIGVYITRDTLSTSLSILNDVSSKEIYDAAKLYVMEYKTTWTNIGDNEYTCLTVGQLVDSGYFASQEVNKNDFVKVVRMPKTKVIESVEILEVCE